MADRSELQVHRSGVRSDEPPKRIFTMLGERDAALIQRALETIPAECRYHHERFEVDYGLHGVGSCCDTGRLPMYRKAAEEALQRALGEQETTQ